MTQKKITIRGKKYPEPALKRLKRKQARKFQEFSREMTSGDPDNVRFDIIWEVLSLFMPTLPEEVLEDLDWEECEQILEDAEIMRFSEQGELIGISDEAGESSASSNSSKTTKNP